MINPAATEYLHGPSPITALVKQQPEDFIVTEDFEPEPESAGEHQWLWVEKRGANTHFVIECLAKFAKVRPQDVGYAGLKDRHAVTRQWFSIQLPGQALLDWQQLQHPDFKVLQVRQQSRKLKTGSLKGNWFQIRLREVSDVAALQARWQTVVASGVPNYFGLQRFGRHGRNLQQVQAWFSGRIRKPKRHEQSIWLSSARSFLFNQIVSERISQHGQSLLAGDVMQLAGSKSYFVAPSLDAELRARVASGDIMATAALWGAGELPAEGVVAELEQQVVARYPDLVAGLLKYGLQQQRRRLWLRPEQPQLSLDEQDPASVWLHFYLTKGSFATSVLRELVSQGQSSHDEDTIE